MNESANSGWSEKGVDKVELIRFEVKKTLYNVDCRVIIEKSNYNGLVLAAKSHYTRSELWKKEIKFQQIDLRTGFSPKKIYLLTVKLWPLNWNLLIQVSTSFTVNLPTNKNHFNSNKSKRRRMRKLVKNKIAKSRPWIFLNEKKNVS